MNRTEMRRCGKQYASEWAARNSKGWEPGMAAVVCADSRCGCWHLRKPPAPREPITRSTTPRVKVPAPRAAPGHMRAAVAMVLAGERTVADAAREFSVDPARLIDQAGREFRRIVMDRDDHGCLGCGAQAEEVQHRVARGMGGSSDPTVGFSPANGASLCRDCHRTCEARDEGMHARGLWLSQYQNPAEFPVFVLAEYGIEARWLLADGTYTLVDPREEAS